MQSAWYMRSIEMIAITFKSSLLVNAKIPVRTLFGSLTNDYKIILLNYLKFESLSTTKSFPLKLFRFLEISPYNLR